MSLAPDAAKVDRVSGDGYRAVFALAVGARANGL
jgi:hypothetical protein